MTPGFALSFSAPGSSLLDSSGVLERAVTRRPGKDGLHVAAQRGCGKSGSGFGSTMSPIFCAATLRWPGAPETVTLR